MKKNCWAQTYVWQHESSMYQSENEVLALVFPTASHPRLAHTASFKKETCENSLACAWTWHHIWHCSLIRMLCWKVWKLTCVSTFTFFWFLCYHGFKPQENNTIAFFTNLEHINWKKILQQFRCGSKSIDCTHTAALFEPQKRTQIKNAHIQAM